jgi:hypothetical protein
MLCDEWDKTRDRAAELCVKVGMTIVREVEFVSEAQRAAMK